MSLAKPAINWSHVTGKRQANAAPAKYGCHFLVWDGEHLVDRVNRSERLIEKFFRLATAPRVRRDAVSRLQVVFDQFENDAVLTWTFEDAQCVMGRTQLSVIELQRLESSFRKLPSWGWGSHGSDASGLEKLGAELFALIPENVQRALRQSSGPLRLTSNIHILPFELALDPERMQLLGSTHQIGRIHFADTVGARASWENFAVLSVAPLYESYPALHGSEDAARLFSAMAPGVPVRTLDGASATAAAVSSVLSTGDSPLLLHFSGHGVSNEQDDVTLVMSDGLVSAANLFGHLPRSSIVFLNACSTGSSFERLSRDLLNQSGSILVGFVGPVTDVGGAIVAMEFYRCLISGACVGEAVQTARETQKAAMPTDHSWMSFVLFGDPLASIVIRDES